MWSYFFGGGDETQPQNRRPSPKIEENSAFEGTGPQGQYSRPESPKIVLVNGNPSGTLNVSTTLMILPEESGPQGELQQEVQEQKHEELPEVELHGPEERGHGSEDKKDFWDELDEHLDEIGKICSETADAVVKAASELSDRLSQIDIPSFPCLGLPDEDINQPDE
jgi:hypothetical protein